MQRKKQPWSKNKIIKAVLLWVGMIGLSWVNATNFDKTEYKYLGEVLGLWVMLNKTLPD